MEKPVLRDEDFWNVLRDKREAREILQLLQARNTELPSLLRKGTGGQKPGIDYAVFNSLVLAYFSGDTVYQDLSSCLNLYSLIRFSAARGGRSVHAPSLYEIVEAYATLLGVYSVMLTTNKLDDAFCSSVVVDGEKLILPGVGPPLLYWQIGFGKLEVVEPVTIFVEKNDPKGGRES